MKKYYQSARIARLLAKFALHTISESEKQELAALSNETGINPGRTLEKAQYQSPDASEAEAREKVWASVKQNISTPKYRFSQRYLRYAAIFAGVAVLSLGAYLLRSERASSVEPIPLFANETVLEYPTGEKIVLKDKTDLTEIIRHSTDTAKQVAEKAVAEIYKIKVSKGSTHTITLEDGTTVILYPESELLFPSFFNSSERSVTLSGEGFFEVKKDPSRYFTVRAGGATVKVLGTSFNVRAYSDEPRVETALVTGKVIMNKTLLLPDQLAIYDRGEDKVRIENMDASTYLERARGLFVFENRSLEEVMREFSLWYGFEYDFKDNSMRAKKFRFKLQRSDDFNHLMSLMEKTGELSFEVSGTKVIILPAK